MTMRLTGALDMLRKSTGKAVCWLVEVWRTDGVVIRFTDHDRNLTVNGDVYLAAQSISMSDEVRGAAMRSSNQDVSGVIEGQTVKIKDLLGNRYRGAKVIEKMVDWRYPWVVFYEAYKKIIQIQFTMTGWVAKVESLSQALSRDKGGRFNGVHSPICGYLLGGIYCRANISSYIQTGVRVSTINSSRLSFNTVSTTWNGTFANKFYAEGEFEFIWAAPAVTGTTTLAITAGGTTLQDTTKSWTVNEHAGKYARVLNTANGWVAEYRLIKSNTSNTLTLARAWSAAHSLGVNYDICPPCENFGQIVPIISYAATNNRIDLYLPSNLLISVGDSGIVRPGCDGSFQTCKVKYGNQLNHGGIDTDAPLPVDLTEIAE